MANYVKIFFPNFLVGMFGVIMQVKTTSFQIPSISVSAIGLPEPTFTNVLPSTKYYQLSNEIPAGLYCSSLEVHAKLSRLDNKPGPLPPYPNNLLGVTIEFLYSPDNGSTFSSRSSVIPVLLQKRNVTQDQDSYLYSAINFGCNVPITCFVENTLILTDKGYADVQDLKKDDIVVTHDGRHVPIKEVIRLSVLSSDETDPFLYKANCFSENYPPIDTYLSPHHSILINNRWDIKGRSIKDVWTNGAHLKHNNFLNENIKQVKIADSFNYYHLYLPDFKTDHLVINNGLVVESYGMDYHITHTHFSEDPRVFIVDLKKKEFDI